MSTFTIFVHTGLGRKNDNISMIVRPVSKFFETAVTLIWLQLKHVGHVAVRACS